MTVTAQRFWRVEAIACAAIGIVVGLVAVTATALGRIWRADR